MSKPGGREGRAIGKVYTQTRVALGSTFVGDAARRESAEEPESPPLIALSTR
jgi:hypothetical protein